MLYVIIVVYTLYMYIHVYIHTILKQSNRWILNWWVTIDLVFSFIKRHWHNHYNLGVFHQIWFPFFRYAVILAFDVRVEREAQEMADSLGVKIFTADIIYHLFDKFMAFREELKKKRQDEFRHIAVFPCKLRVLPQYVFNSRDPIVVGVSVEAGFVKEGTPVCVPSKEVSSLWQRLLPQKHDLEK